MGGKRSITTASFRLCSGKLHQSRNLYHRWGVILAARKGIRKEWNFDRVAESSLATTVHA